MGSNVLAEILRHKRDEIAALRRALSESALRDRAIAAGTPRGFNAALRRVVESGSAAIIAEIKKASPSRGIIRPEFSSAWIAREYAEAGAACLSVLTDQAYFQGDNEHLVTARAACPLPVLRKDFTIDPLQIVEARAIGADAVLLIAAALSSAQMNELAACAHEFGMDVLAEVHNAEELQTVLRAQISSRVLLGINNRDLRTFATRLEVTLDLLPVLPEDCNVVTESGISTRSDIARMRAAGVNRFLVGEALMRQASPGAALRTLLA